MARNKERKRNGSRKKKVVLPLLHGTTLVAESWWAGVFDEPESIYVFRDWCFDTDCPDLPAVEECIRLVAGGTTLLFAKVAGDYLIVRHDYMRLLIDFDTGQMTMVPWQEFGGNVEHGLHGRDMCVPEVPYPFLAQIAAGDDETVVPQAYLSILDACARLLLCGIDHRGSATAYTVFCTDKATRDEIHRDREARDAARADADAARHAQHRKRRDVPAETDPRD